MATNRLGFNPPKINISSKRRTGGQRNKLQDLMSRSQAGNQAMEQRPTGEGGVITKFRDPFSNVEVETPESVKFRKYSVDEVRQLGTSEAITRHKDFLTNLLDKDPNSFAKSFGKANVNIPLLTGRRKGNVLGVPTTLGDEDATNIQRTLEDITDRIIRLRSGAQINVQEEERLRSILPSFKDLTIPVGKTGESYPTIRKSLNDIDLELRDIRQRALQGGWYDADAWHESGPIIPGSTAMSSSTNMDAKTRFLKRKGLI